MVLPCRHVAAARPSPVRATPIRMTSWVPKLSEISSPFDQAVAPDGGGSRRGADERVPELRRGCAARADGDGLQSAALKTMPPASTRRRGLQPVLPARCSDAQVAEAENQAATASPAAFMASRGVLGNPSSGLIILNGRFAAKCRPGARSDPKIRSGSVTSIQTVADSPVGAMATAGGSAAEELAAAALRPSRDRAQRPGPSLSDR